MPKLDKRRAVAESAMKAIIIYDNFTFAARAWTALRRVGNREDLRVQWTIKPWQVNILKEAPSAGKALLDAVDAHLIVFAGPGAEAVPAWLREWLTQWLELRQVQDAALAVFSNGNALEMPTNPELSRLARKHGLSFITNESPAAKPVPDLHVRFSQEQAFPLPLTRPFFARVAMAESFRGVGIND